jgi:hypothetical protein
MEYIVKDNVNIVDVIISQAGDISEWDNILKANNFTSWTPELKIGDIVQIPNVIKQEVNISNYHYGIETLLTDIESTLDAVVVGEFPEIIVLDYKVYYVVKEGETIRDVVLNQTGDLLNWDKVLDINNFTNWCPEIKAGDLILIEGTVNQNNNIKLFDAYPLSNAPNISDLDSQINDLFSTFADTVLFDDDLTEVQFDDDLETVLFN